jgi:hypothetical protein
MITFCISQKAEDFAEKSIKSKNFARFGNPWDDLGVSTAVNLDAASQV